MFANTLYIILDLKYKTLKSSVEKELRLSSRS